MIDWYPATPALIPFGVKLLLLTEAVDGEVEAMLVVTLGGTEEETTTEASAFVDGVTVVLADDEFVSGALVSLVAARALVLEVETGIKGFLKSSCTDWEAGDSKGACTNSED